MEKIDMKTMNNFSEWLVKNEKPSTTFYHIALCVTAITPLLFGLYLLFF